MAKEDEEDWEWMIAAARARGESDEPAIVTEPADILEEDVEDWEAIIAAARDRASEAPAPIAAPAPVVPPVQVAPVAAPVPIAPSVPIAPPVHVAPPVIASDPSAPRTVIPVPALPTSDPQRVRDYVTSMRGPAPRRPRTPSARLAQRGS